MEYYSAKEILVEPNCINHSPKTAVPNWSTRGKQSPVISSGIRMPLYGYSSFLAHRALIIFTCRWENGGLDRGGHIFKVCHLVRARSQDLTHVFLIFRTSESTTQVDPPQSLLHPVPFSLNPSSPNFIPLLKLEMCCWVHTNQSLIPGLGLEGQDLERLGNGGDTV